MGEPAANRSRSRKIPRGRVIVVAMLVLALAAIVTWASQRGVGSFDFLYDRTGWEIGFSVLPYVSSDPYWWTFLVGLINTLVSGAVAIVGATTLGFAIGLARASHSPLLSWVARGYVDIVRNVPVILQAMFWYATYLAMPPAREAVKFAGMRITNRGFYLPIFTESWVVLAFVAATLVAIVAIMILAFRARRRSLAALPSSWLWGFLLAACLATVVALLPRLGGALVIDWPEARGLNIGGGLRLPIEFSALVTALIVYRSAFIAEVFRGGFRSVSSGHLDAAHALGLKAWPTLVAVRVPLALMTIMPPLSSEFLVMIKITSIGLIVGFTDLYSVSTNATTLTGRTLEVMTIMTGAYLVVNFAIATVMNIINERVALRGIRQS